MTILQLISTKRN